MNLPFILGIPGWPGVGLSGVLREKFDGSENPLSFRGSTLLPRGDGI